MAASSMTVKDGNGTNQTVPTITDAAGAQSVIGSLDSSSPHYRAAKNALTPVAATTMVLLIQGSATKTVRVKRIEFWGAATAAGAMPIWVDKASDAGTIGSAVLTALTNTKMDTGAAAATAVVSTVGTANYTTVPLTAGKIGAGRLMFTALTTAATSGEGKPYVLEFGKMSQAAVLRGTSEYITVNLAGGTVPSGGVVDCVVEWSEDAS